jgi:hypothetical protein
MSGLSNPSNMTNLSDAQSSEKAGKLKSDPSLSFFGAKNSS